MIYEIRGQVYSSYLPPQVTHGDPASSKLKESLGDWVQQRQRGYDTVTVETFGNVWTRTDPMCQWVSAGSGFTYYCPLAPNHDNPHGPIQPEPA